MDCVLAGALVGSARRARFGERFTNRRRQVFELVPTRIRGIWRWAGAVGAFSADVRGDERVGDDRDERGDGGCGRRETASVVDAIEDVDDDDTKRRWRRFSRGEFCDAHRWGERRERFVLRARGGAFV